jgi:hypothetical protein
VRPTIDLLEFAVEAGRYARRIDIQRLTVASLRRPLCNIASSAP